MRSSFLVLALLSSLPACSGDDGEEEQVDCIAMTEDDDFVIGLSKTGENGLYTFKLVEFSPAPPARLLNDWTIEVTSTAAGAAPLANATIAVTPYMPQHGHGAGIDVEVEPMATAGNYKLTPINLHMPGLWEVTIQVQAPTEDLVVFKPCIPN